MSFRFLMRLWEIHQRCCCRTNPILWRVTAPGGWRGYPKSRRVEGLPKHTGKESYKWNVKKNSKSKILAEI